MNEDEKFFNQFHEEPRPEFVAAVYKRINKPMNTQRKSISMRQMALSFAALCALLLAALLIYPPTRAQAYLLLRQIGAFTITTEVPENSQPTALPPDSTQKPLIATSAAAASKLAGFQVLAPESVPDGYVSDGAFSILAAGNGKNVVTTFTNPDMGTFILINQYRYGAGDTFVDSVAGRETVQDVQVRGHEGVWITGRMMANPINSGKLDQNSLHVSSWLRWEENGIVYSVMSDNLTLAEMLRLAQSLK